MDSREDEMKRKDWRFWLAILLLVALAIGACRVCTAKSKCVNADGDVKIVSDVGNECPACPDGYSLVECVTSCYEEGE